MFPKLGPHIHPAPATEKVAKPNTVMGSRPKVCAPQLSISLLASKGAVTKTVTAAEAAEAPRFMKRRFRRRSKKRFQVSLSSAGEGEEEVEAEREIVWGVSAWREEFRVGMEGRVEVAVGDVRCCSCWLDAVPKHALFGAGSAKARVAVDNLRQVVFELIKEAISVVVDVGFNLALLCSLSSSGLLCGVPGFHLLLTPSLARASLCERGRHKVPFIILEQLLQDK